MKHVNKSGPAAGPSLYLVLAAALCFFFSLLVMYPGWMTTDSFSQFFDARRGVYRDSTPVLMSWLWNKVLFISDGPAPMLALNLASYWAGFYWLADATRARGGRWSLLVLPVGFWPGIFEQVGFIWKDIIFGTFLFAAWALAVRAKFHGRPMRCYELGLVAVFCIVGVGVKPNGITALPFLFMFIAAVQGAFTGRLVKNFLVSCALSVAVFLSGVVPTLPSEKIRQGNFMVQYTMIYDLLGISSISDRNWLPPYIVAQRQDLLADIDNTYTLGGFGHFIFKGNTSLITMKEDEQIALAQQWLAAVIEHPGIYAMHRWGNLSYMLRVGHATPAWVGDPGIWENEYGLSFTPNPVSDYLGASIKELPWMFLPWLYALICFAAFVLVMVSGRQRQTGAYMLLSVGGFVAPHLFILPAADYRYLYFAYLGTAALLIIAIAVSIVRDTGDKGSRERR